MELDRPSGVSYSRHGREADMRRWLSLFAAALAGASAVVFAGAGFAGSQTTGDYERVVRIVHAGPSDGCGTDTCVGGVMEPITAHFSTVGDRVRVVATVSFRYRTTPGDPAEVSLLWRPAGARRFSEAAPGPSPLAPSRRATTTSMSWSIPGLQARTDYEFTVAVRVRASTEFEVTTKDLVIVLEAS
jgi:hypothetical protein